RKISSELRYRIDWNSGQHQFEIPRPARVGIRRSEFRQTVMVFRLPRPTQKSSSPALRQTVGNELAAPNLAADPYLPLDVGDEGPRGNIAGSAPKQDRG